MRLLVRHEMDNYESSNDRYHINLLGVYCIEIKT